MDPALATEAARLAAAGIPVFPCKADKRPAVLWKTVATADPGGAKRMFLRCRDAALIGMPTGPKSGISVLDVDPQGMTWLAAAWRWLPETRTHQTPRGGYHLLFAHRDGVRNSAGKISAGVDIRGDGGYVIIPPSAGYTVVADIEPAPFPARIAKKLARKERADEKRRLECREKLKNCDVDALARFVAQSRIGERNARLFWAACRAGEAGCADIAALVMAALAAGLTEQEIAATLRSGMARGAADGPR